MIRTTFSDRHENGFRVVGLSNSHVSVEVVPELGARVVSLRDVARGREWLWHPPDARGLFTSALGDQFERSPLAGVDECLPTIAPCEWQGRTLPDHGECWSRAWALNESAFVHHRIATALRLPVSPFDFARTLTLDGNAVVLDYELRSRSERSESFLWSLHPLLRLEAGDRFELPGSCVAPHIVSVHPAVELARTPALQPAGPDGSWIKAFVPAGDGRAAVVRSDGARLVFKWPATDFPWLGIWITRGGWNGFRHLALEPSRGAEDDLALAAASSAFAPKPLAPRETLRWRVTLALA